MRVQVNKSRRYRKASNVQHFACRCVAQVAYCRQTTIADAYVLYQWWRAIAVVNRTAAEYGVKHSSLPNYLFTGAEDEVWQPHHDFRERDHEYHASDVGEAKWDYSN